MHNYCTVIFFENGYKFDLSPPPIPSSQISGQKKIKEKKKKILTFCISNSITLIEGKKKSTNT